MAETTDAYKRLFKKSKPVLQNVSFLRSTYVPETLVARNQQIEIVANCLDEILSQGDVANLYIWGDTGVGKSITIKHVLKILMDGLKADGEDILIDPVMLNCTIKNTEYLACIDILQKLTGVSIKLGLKFTDYLNDLWAVIEKKASEHKFYALVIIFDEVDHFIDPNNIFYQLTRALPDGVIQRNNVSIGIIAASNKKDFLSTLDPSVFSSATFSFSDFPDYNEKEVFEILDQRRQAFAEGTVSDEVLEYCATKVANKYHGDARLAIKILYEAGKIANKNNAKSLTCKFIDMGEKFVNDKATTEMLQKISLHDKLLILAAHSSKQVFVEMEMELPPHTGVVLAAYQKICELVGEGANGETHMSSRITALDNKQLIHADYIKGRGNTRFVRVADDVDAVIETLLDPDIMEKLNNSYGDLDATIRAKVKRPIY